jgi:ABC-type phosphate transport system substrate-binding protein
VLLSTQALQVDSALPVYQRVSGVSGSINSVGSDTMNNMMTLWAESFRKFYPSVRLHSAVVARIAARLCAGIAGCAAAGSLC